jgi:hypothetical protein
MLFRKESTVRNRRPLTFFLSIRTISPCPRCLVGTIRTESASCKELALDEAVSMDAFRSTKEDRLTERVVMKAFAPVLHLVARKLRACPAPRATQPRKVHSSLLIQSSYRK